MFATTWTVAALAGAGAGLLGLPPLWSHQQRSRALTRVVAVASVVATVSVGCWVGANSATAGWFGGLVSHGPRSDQRVAIIASGHMANSVGGPGMLRIRTDPVPEFDLTMKALLTAGDAEAVIREANWDRLLAAGNGTAGFLDFVLLLGAARGAAPSYVDLNSTRMTTASFFLSWDAAEDGTP